MKFLKSISTVALALTLLLSAGCSANQPVVKSNLFAGSHWLKSTEVGGVGQVDETCVYDITFKANTPTENSETTEFLSASDFSGTLTTKLTKASYNEQECYKFTTEMSVTGTYHYKDQSAIITDYACSEVYFLGLTSSLAPLYSKKYTCNTSPLISSILNTAQFITMEYTVESVYDLTEKTATVTLIGGDKSTEGYKYSESQKVYENYAKSGSFFDNESLLFIPRAADFAEGGFSQVFYTIDAPAEKIHKMLLSVNSNAPTSEVELEKFISGGIEHSQKFPVYNATISISNTFSGSDIDLYYATDVANHQRRLIKMETQLPYTCGTLVYTLKEVSYK